MTWFSHVTIRARLIAAMALSLLLLVAVGLFSLQALATVDRATKDLYARWLPAVHALSEIKYVMASHRLRFIRAILTPELEDRAVVFDSAERRRDDVAALSRAFATGLTDPVETRRFADAMAAWDAYLDEERRIRDGLSGRSAAEISALVNGPSRLAFDAVYAAINRAIAFYNTGADRSGAEAVATFSRAMRLNLTLFFFALVLMAVFVVLVVRSIGRPIERITETMRRLADGDRTVSVAGLEGTNEIGRMAAAVDVFRNYLIERDAAREALERAYENLEGKVEARSSELRIANAALHAEVEERDKANRQLKSMQEELIRTENLAVIGQLSAGIAHELAQPLAALATLSENAVRFLDLGDEATVRGNLDRIVRMVDRMGILTSRLRSFARRTGAEREVIDLGRSVENALALLGHRHDREHMRIVLDPSQTPVFVHANAVRVEQILVNLISNAFDATRGVADAVAVIAWTASGAQAVLTVTDNGPGFAPDILTRIFEPFFTTKTKSGGGLGLGLAISADIARIYGGSLTAAEAPQGGAVFTLALPLADPTGTAEPGGGESR
ncbi:ATP-binding protein [Rhodoplanes sp. TEM]|uniref:histidine kinase n=1 Tax=Rhodoplanes tepidamans TaxID=200616 RepID=A0ABT5J5Y5_RHOTP|nr:MULTISPECIES: ATP-binding protein [Rhodoplanes]MDC7785070.1 ATP-binding protein [Rhodoplanes tepidamans]MDC7982544.1 ATP-binding protein [Rhodoplanes sp. TEM]MDQ0356559.1 phosphoglycerate-specific signal transduction histidine kinase [Rhodoplanes tepidamans]